MAILLNAPYSQFFSLNGTQPLNGGKVYAYEAGTLTAKNTYTDSSGTTPASNPVILDSAGRAEIWISGTYKFIIKDSADNTIDTVDNVTVAGSGSSVPFAVAGGTVDAITANFTPDLTLTDGLMVTIRAVGANTTATPTFTPDGGTARTIVKNGGQSLSGGDIPGANADIILQYDLSNTRWELLNPTVAGDSFGTRLLHVRDEKASGTNGGTFTAGAARTRDLNQTKTNEISGASLAGNQITLPAGTYMIQASCPACDVTYHRAFLYNVTDSSDVVLGTSERITGSTVSNRSFIQGKFTISSTKVFEIRHLCNNTGTTFGFGIATGLGTEVYTEVLIWKVA